MNGYIDLGIELRVKKPTDETYANPILVAVKGMRISG